MIASSLSSNVRTTLATPSFRAGIEEGDGLVCSEVSYRDWLWWVVSEIVGLGKRAYLGDESVEKDTGVFPYEGGCRDERRIVQDLHRECGVKGQRNDCDSGEL